MINNKLFSGLSWTDLSDFAALTHLIYLSRIGLLDISFTLSNLYVLHPFSLIFAKPIIIKRQSSYEYINA